MQGVIVVVKKFCRLFHGWFFIAHVLVVTVICSALIVCLHRIPWGKGMLRGIERWWARLITWGARVKIDARLKHLDPGQNYLFLANHQSHLDIPILLQTFSSYAPRFVAKEELFKIPLFGPGMLSLGHVAVDRDNPKRAMRDIQLAAARARNGQSIWMFPEGTRNNTEKPLQDFHLGAFILAIKTGLPVVPVVISGTKDILPRGKLLIRPGKVIINTLDPMDITGYTLKDRERLRDEIWQIMYRNLLELKDV